MNNGKVIDISGIPNFWIVYIKPFDNEDESIVNKYQENCIKNRMFGMGWHEIKLDSKFFQTKLNDETFEEYKKVEKREIVQKTLEKYKEIKENDLIIARLKNGNYYIGQVKKEAYYCSGKDSLLGEENTARFSWYCEVDTWFEFNEDEIPSDIVGRFSQRRHQTIQKINNDRIKLLIIKLFQEKSNNKLKYFDKKTNRYLPVVIPKIILNKDNFTSALNYMELEDLVYTYIINENPNYILYPSKCKATKIKYEFTLLDKNCKEKEITCQVKNNLDINYSKYIEDAKKQKYKTIYLFSGKCITEKKEENESIKIIDKEELYKTLISNKEIFKALKENFNKYYVLSDENDNFENLKYPDNWKKVKNFKEKSNMHFQKNDNYIFFKINKRIYYNNQFKRFIILPKQDNNNDEEIIVNIIEEWSKFIFDL